MANVQNAVGVYTPGAGCAARLVSTHFTLLVTGLNPHRFRTSGFLFAVRLAHGRTLGNAQAANVAEARNSDRETDREEVPEA